MRKIELFPENIGSVLAEKLKNPDCIFIFPTDTVMNSWIDWIVLNPQKSGCEAVAFERFMAWDNFKGTYLAAQQEGKSVIPSILRKFFVSNLIARNSQKPAGERLQVLINPSDLFAKNASSFEDWIAKNIPSLHFWQKRLKENASSYGELDSEDKDYLFIYEEYKKFLDVNKLFEPSWIEGSDISDKSREFIIFYPELLEDFGDFEDIFKANENISLYCLPEKLPSPKVYKYSDSRKELRQTMLRIIKLVKDGLADWSEIALSIPDLETYRPYLDREFSLYGIPYVIKAGQPLTKNCAGRIFREIYDCHSSGFSFDSVRALLLDECLPWKDTYKEIKEELIREGNRMRCICSPGEKDIWLGCFASKKARSKNEEEIKDYEELAKFYKNLKFCIEDFFTQEDFAGIKNIWMKFKRQFLMDDSSFSEEANNIISRCIKELEELMRVEKQYKENDLLIPSHYEFFLKLLDGKTYTPQTKACGVNIFTYKLTAAGNFKFQLVIDASQNNIEIQNRRLTFLNSIKRAKLHLIEDDRSQNATEVFIKLYAKKTEGAGEDFVHFSFAEDSFSGFTISHSLLTEVENPPLLDESDYILSEKDFISGKKDSLSELTEKQKEELNCWLKINRASGGADYEINGKIKEAIAAKYSSENSLLSVSARGDLENFFPCPRRWVLKSLLKLHDDTLDTNLMQSFDMGNLNHKILELFMKEFIDRPLPYYKSEENCFYKMDADGLVDCSKEVLSLLSQKTDEAIKAPSDFRDSLLAIQALESQKDKISKVILNCLKTLCTPFTDAGFGGCKVVNSEGQYQKEAKAFNWFGKIDLLLQTPDSSFIIVDYKNSAGSIPAKKNFTADENDILKDFQMPLYFKLKGAENPDTFKEKIYGGYFLNITDAKLTTVSEMDNKSASPDKFCDTLRVLDDYGLLYKETVEKEGFEPFTNKDRKNKLNVKPYEECIKCPCKAICRTTYITGKKELKEEK